MSRRFAGKAILLAVGPGPLPSDVFDGALHEIGARATSSHQLDLLMFREDPDGGILAQARARWPGQVDEFAGAQYLAQVDQQARTSVSEFVAFLRESLVSTALATGGAKWAKRFGSLWWKTQISEKNTPADDAWWQIFRAAALRARLAERDYSHCVVIGDAELVDLAAQVAKNAKVEFISFPQNGERFRLHRVLMARVAGCLYLLIATVLAKGHQRLRKRSVPPDNQDSYSKPPLLYTWFPRIWTDRFGDWKDRYQGDVVRHLAEQVGTEPVLALRIYDRTQLVTPSTYWGRLKLLSDPSLAMRRYVILESFGRVLEILRFYLNPLDVYRYFMMTRHLDFDRAFLCDGLDVGGLFRRSIWRSVLVSWPHLSVLQNNAMRLAQDQQPSVVVLYCFEFVYGRAIIEGTRQGAPDAPIVGMQHGPISPMKLLYAGVANERIATPDGGKPLPEPDIYAVDGPLASGILERRGIPRHAIRVTGPARFDQVWIEIQRLREQSEGRRDGKTRILVADAHHDAAFVFGTSLKTLGKNPSLELVLKPHPDTSYEEVSRWVGSQANGGEHEGATITVVRSGSIYEWMAQSDIFLGTFSSTSVEALAFGLPVILLIPNSTPDMSLFHGQRVPLLKASGADELRTHVDRLAADHKFRAEYATRVSAVLDASFGPTDSLASLRMARLCAEVSTQGKVTTLGQRYGGS